MKRISISKSLGYGKRTSSNYSVADIFRAKIVDVAMESLMIELTGNQAKIDAFIKLLDDLQLKN